MSAAEPAPAYTAPMHKITPCLWMEKDIGDAIAFYKGVFRNLKVVNESRYGEGGPMPEGTLMVAIIELEGQRLMLLNGGPAFNESISLAVDCKDQEEVDRYWDALTADGGEESMCGWCKDKFGLSWQIVPAQWPSIMGGKDKAGAARAMQAMMKMRKLDIQTLQDAYDGKYSA